VVVIVAVVVLASVGFAALLGRPRHDSIAEHRRAIETLRDIAERALALDARAFRPGRRRTSLTPVDDPPVERAARLVIYAAIIALFVWRLSA